MKKLTGTFILLVVVTGSVVAAMYLQTRREFLHDFNAGVRAYLAGHADEAQRYLRGALERRPENAEVRHLLRKTYMDQAWQAARSGNAPAAKQALAQATVLARDREEREALQVLAKNLENAFAEKPKSIPEILQQAVRETQRGAMSAELRETLEEWASTFKQSQGEMIKRFWETQDDWLSRLESERRSFQKALVACLCFFAFGGALLVGVLIHVLNVYLGRRGVMVRLLEDHYHRVVAALPAGSVALLGPPPSQAASKGSQRLDIIEAELVETQDPELARQKLQEFLEGEDPWVRARAAKALYAYEPQLAIEELKKLTRGHAIERLWPGVWALSELATVESLTLLKPLLESPLREVRQAAIRSLVQMQSRTNLSAESERMVHELLEHARAVTGWII